MSIPYLQKSSEGQLVPAEVPGQSYDQWEAALMRLTGCNSNEFAQDLLNQVLAANGLNASSPIEKINGIIGAMAAMEPSNPLEALLIAQMLACSRKSLELLSKSQRSTDPDICQTWSGLSVRMANLYAKQMDTLGKMRRNGVQKVHVEHLHMENSQAVIGSAGRS